MKKTNTVKLEEFSVQVKKLVLDEILDIAEEIAKQGYLDDFINTVMSKAKTDGWLKIIKDNRSIFNHITNAAIIFPENKSIGSIYPEELIVLFTSIMEVNDGFLEAMDHVIGVKAPTKKQPQRKSSRTSKPR